MYEEKCIRGNSDEDNIEELSKRVSDYCKLMATDVDKIREKYWEYVAGNFRIQMDRLNDKSSKKVPVVGSEEEPFQV